jgi:hypothetical protein
MAKSFDIRHTNLLEVAYARTRSFRKAAVVGEFVVSWAMTRARLGREPSIDQFAADWKVSARTAYRQLAVFREVFPEPTTPGQVCDLIAHGAGGRVDLASAVPA